jgi:hypothetical protein
MRIAVIGELEEAEATNLAGEETVDPFAGDETLTVPAKERTLRVITATAARNRLCIGIAPLWDFGAVLKQSGE